MDRIRMFDWRHITIFALAAALGIVLYFYLVGTPAPSAQERPKVAYLDMGAASKDVYLAVWTDQRGSNNDIVGARISPRGTIVNTNLVVAVNPANLKNPAVVANTTDQEFLVVWEDERNGIFKDIYGQRVLENGRLVGTNFVVSTAVDYQQDVSIAYNSKQNRYLVVWQDHRGIGPTQTDIYGQLVAHDGKLIGGNFVICNNKADSYHPAVAYNASDDEFLVVWQDYRHLPSTDIYGRRVSSDGALLDGEIEIAVSPDSGSQYSPEVSYNSTNQMYLVVWDDWRNYSSTKRDIYGQRIKHTGILEGGNFGISTASGYQGEPVVASEKQSFLVSFDDSHNKSTTNIDIYAQRVSVAGSLLGKSFAVSDQKSDQGRSSIAYASNDTSFLVVWQDWRNLTAASTDIYGQHVDVKGTLIKPPASDVNFIVSVPAIKH